MSADGTVLYGDDRRVPRRNFISWAEAREMQASGLIEFASHSYDLHRGVQANPQGNLHAAAVTWRYDPRPGATRMTRSTCARIRADLSRSRSQIAANLGRPPRAIVWPYGRYTGPGAGGRQGARICLLLTLEPEPAYTSDLFAIHRYYPVAAIASLGDIVEQPALRCRSDPATRRIACLTLDALAAPAAAQQDEVLGR